MAARQQMFADGCWLALGTILLVLARGNHAWALAAWLYAPFFLVVTRNGGWGSVYVAVPLLTGLASQISFWKFTANSYDSPLFYIPFVGGWLFGTVLWLDRWASWRWNHPAALLVFPCAATSYEFLLNWINPFGTTGAWAYSQLEFSTFRQLASLTGIWGLTFVMAWFGSIVAALLRERTRGLAPRQAVVFAVVFLAVNGYGWIRIQTAPRALRVRIAGLYVHDRDREGLKLWKLVDDRNVNGIRIVAQSIMDRLILATKRQAELGARIVVWSELSPMVLATDIESVQEELGRLASELGIYLVVAPYVTQLDGTPSENKVVIIAPTGQVVMEHLKFGGNLLEGTVKGNGIPQVVRTELGNLSAIVCWDADFPSAIRRVGVLRTEILFVPSSDWREITPDHAAPAVFRGIENGCSVVRPTQNGLSVMSDGTGRRIAELNHYETKPWVFAADVPTQRVFAVYPWIGDLFGWAALVGAIGLTTLVSLQKLAA